MASRYCIGAFSRLDRAHNLCTIKVTSLVLSTNIVNVFSNTLNLHKLSCVDERDSTRATPSCTLHQLRLSPLVRHMWSWLIFHTVVHGCSVYNPPPPRCLRRPRRRSDLGYISLHLSERSWKWEGGCGITRFSGNAPELVYHHGTYGHELRGCHNLVDIWPGNSVIHQRCPPPVIFKLGALVMRRKRLPLG